MGPEPARPLAPGEKHLNTTPGPLRSIRLQFEERPEITAWQGTFLAWISSSEKRYDEERTTCNLKEVKKHVIKSAFSP